MIFLYGALKYAAYAGWCWAGLKAFRPEREGRFAAACGLGALRLSMGLLFGAGIWLASMAAVGPLHGSQVLVYLLVYVPVRWVEWAIMDALMLPGPFRWGDFLLGNRARGWRLRGILISCLADIPMIVSLGGALPIGRFMC